MHSADDHVRFVAERRSALVPALADPELFTTPAMRAALASRDISTVYRLLSRAGMTQRMIAEATGQSQSEVCEILQGRQVIAYDVLERIASRLGVPREAARGASRGDGARLRQLR